MQIINPRIAKFEKVSFEQFMKDCDKARIQYGSEENLRERWHNIKLPQRATSDAAGYDFYLPFGVVKVGDIGTVIPTGVRCSMSSGFCLLIMPRSGYGFKYGLRLANTVGLIDKDYYYADNEGHIMVKLIADDDVRIERGDRFVQGVFFPMGITVDDDVEIKRKGGLGSTGK